MALKHAFRLLWKYPTVTLVATLTLAVAMAGSVVIFSAIDLIFRLAPIEQPDRVVFLEAVNPERGRTRIRVSVPDYFDWRRENQSFEHLAALTLGTFTLTGIDQPVRVSAVLTTANLFDVWGLKPALGRSFTPDEDRIGAARVVMLTDKFWHRQFAASPGVLGRVITLDEEAHTIIGVLPPSANSGALSGGDVWVALEPVTTNPDRALRNLMVTGFMKPELTLKQSESDIQNIARRLEQEYPATNANFNARALPPVDAFSGGSALILIAVLGLVAVLLMAIACANVASLLLAWAAARQREFLVRIALGSGRWRLLKDLMMEHFVLSLMAGAAGLVLSHWGLQIVRTIAGETSPIFAEMVINQRVLLFTLLLSLVTPLLFGVAPLLRSVRSDLTEGLKDGVRSLGAGVRGRFVRGSLVVCQIGLALTLLIGVGLLVRTMLVIQALEKGLNPENLLTFRVDLPERRYSEQNQIRTFYENLIAGIEGLPGVESAGMINRLPFAERELIENFHIDGRPAQADQPFWAARAVVTDRYRQTAEVRLIKGRDFAPADSQSAPAVALISEFAAQRYWPNEDPIGKRVRFDRPGADSSWIEIVGIVNDVRNSDPDAGLIPQIYVPYSQNPVPAVAVLVRATSNPAALTPAIRAVASGLDSNQAIYDVATMNRVIYDDTANDVILLGILVALSAIALGLAASGVYAVTAYSVARRTSEIGLRMALGAQTSTVLRMVLRQNLTLVVIGALVGLSGGLAFGQLTSSFLYQVSPTDSVTFTSMTSVVFIAAFLGCYLPARRAMRIDPISALSLKNM